MIRSWQKSFVVLGAGGLMLVLSAVAYTEESPVDAVLECASDAPSECGIDMSSQGLEQGVIRVGLRSDAKPFSYVGTTDPMEPIMPGYRGYMVRICRRVLREMVTSGAFSDFRVEAVKVTARYQFDMLEKGEVDILCGPSSVTSARLRALAVSPPLFLSGMTYGYVDPDHRLEPEGRQFPRSEYCGPIIGVLQGTTAAASGLQELAAGNLLLRFDEPLTLFLAGTSERLSEYKKKEEIVRKMTGHTGEILDPIWQQLEPLYREVQKSLAAKMETSECPNGYEGLPVRQYQTHDEGIKDFCNGKVKYYLGDYDIIQRKVEAIADCPVILERFTSSREIYGAFMRKGFNHRTRVDASEKPCTGCSPLDIVFFSVFNHTLLRMMQQEHNVLEYAYDKEFGDLEKSEDLKQFYRSFKVASDR